jgi:hypothetical protein
MAEYDKTNTGTLNKNDKGDNEKRPDYKGKIDIEGTLYWLSAWIREGNDGKFLSLKAEKAEKKAGPVKKSATGGLAEMEDSIPF